MRIHLKWTILLIPALLGAGSARGQERLPVDDFGRRDLLMTGPSTSDGALGAFVNPAAWGISGPADLALWWNDDSVQENVLDNAGVSFGSSLGFTVQRFTMPAPEGRLRVQESQIGFATGNRAARFGAAWRWAGGDDEETGRESGAVAGVIVRPGTKVSCGVSSFWSARNRESAKPSPMWECARSDIRGSCCSRTTR